MSTASVITRKRPPTPAWMWGVWFVLTALCLASFYFVFVAPIARVATLDIYVVLTGSSIVGLVALIAPVVAALALMLRFWRPAALGLIAFCILAQLAYLAAERFTARTPEAGDIFDNRTNP